jgi:hypothetical protein
MDQKGKQQQFVESQQYAYTAPELRFSGFPSTELSPALHPTSAAEKLFEAPDFKHLSFLNEKLASTKRDCHDCETKKL